MTIMFVVGGLVLGLLVFLWFRRKEALIEKRAKWKGTMLTCPNCYVAFDAGGCLRREGLRGTFMTCSCCGRVSIWNMDVVPPRLK